MANNSVDGGELNAVANENDTAISTDHSEYSYMDGGKQKKNGKKNKKSRRTGKKSKKSRKSRKKNSKK